MVSCSPKYLTLICAFIPLSNVAASASACDTIPGNLVSNCGFEAGVGGVSTFGPGWTFTPATTGSDSGTWSDNPRSGVQNVFFGSLSSGVYDSIQQTIATVPGEAYTFSFYLLTDGSSRDFQASYDGILIYDNSNFGNGVYTQYSFTVIGTGSDTIAFRAFNTTSFDSLDDVSFIGASTTTVPVGGEDAFQIGYVAQLNNADTVINLVNTGASAGSAIIQANNTVGNLCVNIYIFDPQQDEVACCSCKVSPDQLLYLNAGGPTESVATSWGVPVSAGGNGVPALLWNTIYGPGLYPFNSAVVKLLATNPNLPGGQCNNIPAGTNGQRSGNITAANVPPAALAPGLAAWITHPHPTNGRPTSGPNGTQLLPVGIGETSFDRERLSSGELTALTQGCQYLQNFSGGRGICTCPTEAQAGGFAKAKLQSGNNLH